MYADSLSYIKWNFNIIYHQYTSRTSPLLKMDDWFVCLFLTILIRCLRCGVAKVTNEAHLLTLFKFQRFIHVFGIPLGLSVRTEPNQMSINSSFLVQNPNENASSSESHTETDWPQRSAEWSIRFPKWPCRLKSECRIFRIFYSIKWVRFTVSISQAA